MLLSLAFFLSLSILLRQLRAQNPIHVLFHRFVGQHLLPVCLVPLILRLLLGKQFGVLVGELRNLRDRFAVQRVKRLFRRFMLCDLIAVTFKKFLLVP